MPSLPQLSDQPDWSPWSPYTCAFAPALPRPGKCHSPKPFTWLNALKIPFSFKSQLSLHLPWEIICLHSYVFSPIISSVQFSCVRFFATPWTVACQASLSITNYQSLLKLMSIESVMPSNHLILYCPLLLLPSIFPIIRVSSNESVLHIR